MENIDLFINKILFDENSSDSLTESRAETHSRSATHSTTVTVILPECSFLALSVALQ